MQTLATLILAAVFASGPAFAQGGFLGISLEESGTDAAGAVVAAVETRSAAAVMGLQPGDRITRVDDVAVADPRALASLIAARLPGEVVELGLVRDGEPRELLGVLGRRPAMSRTPGVPAVPGVPSVPGVPGVPPMADAPDWDARGFAVPELPELPNWEEFQWDDGAFRLQLPPMELRGFEFEDFAPRMEELREQLHELQGRHRELLRDFREQWREHGQNLRERMPHVFVFPRDGADGEARTRVWLRYPEATPEAERERLRAEAIEKYGPEVEIEFSGTGTSVRIERSVTRSGSAPADPTVPPAPPSPDEGQREF